MEPEIVQEIERLLAIISTYRVLQLEPPVRIIQAFNAANHHLKLYLQLQDRLHWEKSYVSSHLPEVTLKDVEAKVIHNIRVRESGSEVNSSISTISFDSYQRRIREE